MKTVLKHHRIFHSVLACKTEIRQNAITEGDLECILTRNCEGTEQLRVIIQEKEMSG